VSEKKREKVRLENLEIGKIYWSNHYNEYIIYIECDFDFDYIFEFTERNGYCVPELTNIEEAPAIIQLLYGKD
jgi:hypothetical protein